MGWGRVSTSTTPTLKAKPRQHSIDLRNDAIVFLCFLFSYLFKKENYFGDMYGDGPDKKGPHDWTSMGPKGIKEALALFLSYDKSNGSWLKQDSNPPPPI